MSEGSAENRPLCEGIGDICRLSTTSADIRPMSASSAREPPLSVDVRRHLPPVRPLRRQWPGVRHPARDAAPDRGIMAPTSAQPSKDLQAKVSKSPVFVFCAPVAGPDAIRR
jgi:hypothetical protein